MRTINADVQCPGCGVHFYPSCDPADSVLCGDCEAAHTCPRCTKSVPSLVETECGDVCAECGDELEALSYDDPFARNYLAEVRADWALSVMKDNGEL